MHSILANDGREVAKAGANLCMEIDAPMVVLSIQSANIGLLA